MTKESHKKSRASAGRKKRPAEAPQQGEFVFGRHAVAEALDARRGNKLFIQEDARGTKIEALKAAAVSAAVPVQWVPKSKLDLLSGGQVHQGVVLGVTPYEYYDLDGLLDKVLSAKQAPFLLILDSLEDPHNFGSILRTADATGVDGIIIPKHRAVGITSIVSKTSTGAVEHVPVARVTNLARAIQKLKSEQFWVYGTDMSGTDYRQWQVDGPIALIIGNEGKGMSKLLKQEADEMLTIPITGHVQSLNAGVAAGLLMYEVYRKRHPI